MKDQIGIMYCNTQCIATHVPRYLDLPTLNFKADRQQPHKVDHFSAPQFEKRGVQMVYKPGSVPKGDGHSSRTFVTKSLMQPTRIAKVGPIKRDSYLVLLQVGFTMPFLLPKMRCALTAPFHPYLDLHQGGLFSVALSLGSPPPGVTRHLVPMEPGLSSVFE